MAESMSRGIEFSTPEYKVAANTLIEAGSMVAIERASNSNKGYAVPASAAANKLVVGLALRTVDNRTTNTVGNSGLVGGAVVAVETSYCSRGLRAFEMLNDTGTAVAQADVGANCYIKDALTVTGDSTGTSVAGRVLRINSAGNPLVVFNA